MRGHADETAFVTYNIHFSNTLIFAWKYNSFIANWLKKNIYILYHVFIKSKLRINEFAE